MHFLLPLWCCYATFFLFWKNRLGVNLSTVKVDGTSHVLSYCWWFRNPANSWYGTYLIIYRVFIHPRCLAGFLNHQKYVLLKWQHLLPWYKTPQQAYSDRENDGTLGMVHLILNPTYTLMVGIYWPPFSLYPQIRCNKCFIPQEELHNKLLDGRNPANQMIW